MRYVVLIAVAIAALIGNLFSHGELEKATIKVGGVSLIVEVAATQRTREKGLMRRKELPEGTGMLFIYPKERIGKLWMRNTIIPLSAAFIKDDGSIANIVKMEKTGSEKVYQSKGRVKYALEVPLGYFEKNGITAGDHCEIPDLPVK